MTVKMNGKYRTRDGRAVRILATDLVGASQDDTVAAAIKSHDGRSEDVTTYQADGRYDIFGESARDLVEVPETFEITKYAAVWQKDDGEVYALVQATRQLAEEIPTSSNERFVGIFPVTIKGELPPRE